MILFLCETYPNSVRCHPSVPFHLMEHIFRQISARNHENTAHLPYPPSYHPRYHGRHPRSVQQPTVLRPSSTDPICRVQPVSSLSFSPTASSRISLSHIKHKQGVSDAHLLNRLCLICFVVNASTESNSTIILIMRSIIIGVGGIVV